MKPLEAYHSAWLAEHPNRSEGWLRERLADGFHVHHADGDHFNDDPGNLVLIDGQDHMRLHGMKTGVFIHRSGGGQRGPQKMTLAAGLLAYEARARGATWSEAAREAACGGNNSAAGAAAKYAQSASLPWPPAATTG